MKNKLLPNFTFVVLLSGMLLSSCQKEKLTPVSKDKPETFTSASALAKTISRTEMVFAALNMGSGSFKTGSAFEALSCASINTDSVSMPRVTVIYFGESGCLGDDGVTRRGKMIITYDGDHHDAGTTIITTLSHYYEDDVKLTGSDTMQNLGINGNGKVYYTISNDYTWTFPNNGGDEKVVLVGGCEWQAGEETETTDDDLCKYNFTANITFRTGDAETLVTTSPCLLNYTPGCSTHIVEGGFVRQRAAMVDSFWDFGDGTCDNFADVTENGITTTVELP
jgi:hypothetical protein